jgi:hypothetical protein
MNRRNFILGVLTCLGAYGVRPDRVFPGERKNNPADLPPSTDQERKTGEQEAHLIALRSKSAFSWDGVTYPYVDSISQESVQGMIDEGLKCLTGMKETRAAWRSLFNYRKGERVLIKPNLNWIDCEFQKIITSPQVINGLVRGLTLYQGIKEKDIFLYDVSRTIPLYYQKRIPFDIHFVGLPASYLERGRRKFFGDLTSPSSQEIETTFPAKGKKGEDLKCFLPRIAASGDHLINLPILKAHPFLLFSGAMKNHFGSLSFKNGTTSPEPYHGTYLNQYIVDVNVNKHLRNITRLVICDALAGTWSDDYLGQPEKFKTFGSGSPSSLFLSRDPLIMDLYLSEILGKEREVRGLLPLKSDGFLAIAQKRLLGKNIVSFTSRVIEL